ncbi:hypothetical protein RB595_006044 [Gaeumannomyces hyphopodioides]
MAEATRFKEEGNRHFQQGDFAGAESLYSKAIILDPKNAALFTNRAMARLKQNFWDLAISDCTDCLKLTPDSFKAHYYMAQAKAEERFDLDGALNHATVAHQLCVATNDRSLPKVTELVLRCKKDRWEDRERRREREDARLEAEVLALLGRERDGELDALRAEGGGDGEAVRRMVLEDYVAKARQVADVFERSRSAAAKRKTVPDWAIDDIGFGFMVDPVIVSLPSRVPCLGGWRGLALSAASFISIWKHSQKSMVIANLLPKKKPFQTKTGKSYERATIMEHLRRHPTDPLTREPLQPSDLRPNIGLKQACDEFLDENGWAADW